MFFSSHYICLTFVALQDVTEVKAFATGLLGLRVWTLQAFDEEGNLIAEEKDNYGMLGNAQKLADFIDSIEEKGYQLTADQFADLCDKLTVGFNEMLSFMKEKLPYLEKLAPIVLKAFSGDIGVSDIEEVLDLLTQLTSSDRQAGNTIKHMFSVLVIILDMPYFCSTPRGHKS